MVRRYVWYERPWACYIKCVLWSNVCAIQSFGSIGFVTLMQPFPMVRSLQDVISWYGPLKVGLYAMVGALALYYRSLRMASTLLRKGNISGRPCMGIMTYKALDFSVLKQISNYHWFYTIEL
jgi:hypothetical protein